MSNVEEIIRIKSVEIDGKPSVEVYLHGNEAHLESLLYTALMSTPKLKAMMINAVSMHLFEEGVMKERAEQEMRARLN